MSKPYPPAPEFTLEQIADGVRACRDNAIRLTDEAQALLDRGSHATALFLATIAQEELGKIQYILTQAFPLSEQVKARAWALLSDHRAKLRLREGPAVVVSSGKMTEQESNEIHRLVEQHHRSKLEALYVGRFANGRWPVPQGQVSPADAARVVAHVAKMAREQDTPGPVELTMMGPFIAHHFINREELLAQLQNRTAKGIFKAARNYLVTLPLDPPGDDSSGET